MKGYTSGACHGNVSLEQLRTLSYIVVRGGIDWHRCLVKRALCKSLGNNAFVAGKCGLRFAKIPCILLGKYYINIVKGT